jgi:tetratricopeptide (TPR) repeat protein
MYQQALAGYEKVLGSGHTSTSEIVFLLVDLFSTQRELAEAEIIYQRALAGYEKALSLGNKLVVEMINNLGNFYADEGRLMEADTMCTRALTAIGCVRYL